MVQKAVNPESLAPAVRFFHRRYSVPVVATLHRDGPRRFTDLLQGLSRASRDTLAETLTELQEAGVITHAKGDAKYSLTEAGKLLGEAAIGATEVVTTDDLLRVVLKKWPMMVLVAVGRGHQRFNEVKMVLPGITSGALSPALKDLESIQLVERLIDEGYPPTVSYSLTPKGWALFPAMDRIVRAAAAAVIATNGTT